MINIYNGFKRDAFENIVCKIVAFCDDVNLLKWRFATQMDLMTL